MHSMFFSDSERNVTSCFKSFCCRDIPITMDCIWELLNKPSPLRCLCWGIHHSNRKETTAVCAAGDLTQDLPQTNGLSMSYVPSSWCL